VAASPVGVEVRTLRPRGHGRHRGAPACTC